ncbi:hypothetical protein HELRODRAFT_160909 [Helobdella robusta]|uniref:Uncharacterized protein n=1 Tax=Helobdella robusta TaxID=6412 RepID=T1EQU6_HELRO|nr:hypothetical protein HELRODRAFT_160909 [Helobdella robusta]ESO06714.1 hypothetical protein HELRODRAFT_160909 [Helobdella robusta]
MAIDSYEHRLLKLHTNSSNSSSGSSNHTSHHSPPVQSHSALAESNATLVQFLKGFGHDPSESFALSSMGKKHQHHDGLATQKKKKNFGETFCIKGVLKLSK